MVKMRIFALVTILLLFGAASAQFEGFLTPICSNLFGSTTSSPTGANVSVLVQVSFVVVFLVLVVLGIVYAIGYGFGIDSLKAFVRTEYIESFFNLILIVFIAGGLGFAGSAISFLSSVAGIGSTSTSVNSVYDAYFAICTNYLTNGAGTILGYAAQISTEITILDIFKGTLVQAAPGDFGFGGLLFSGLQPVDNIYDIQAGFYMAMAGMFIGIPVLLWIIYNLFPWFLYTGVLLRAFPWTRAAGGSFIALFIAFYIVFPAIILPFSEYGVSGNGGAISCSAGGALPSCSAGTPSCSNGATPSCVATTPTCVGGGSPPTCQNWDTHDQINSISNMVGFSPSLITGTLGVFFGGAYDEVKSFSATASAFAVQILGVVIALLISLDIVEVLGDLLGAPSMHTRDLFRKVI